MTEVNFMNNSKESGQWHIVKLELIISHPGRLYDRCIAISTGGRLLKARLALTLG